MRNKLVRLLTMVMVAGSVLTACGGNQDVNKPSNDETEVSTEKNSGDSEESTGLATMHSDFEYVESEYCYVVPSEEYLDTTYVDGEELDTSNWEEVYQIVTIKESINIFNGNKAIMGYLKPGIGCIYVSTNGEWSRVAFGTELGERGDFPKSNVIVRTEDLKAVMEVADTEEGYGPNVMSDSVKEYFDRIREGIVEENKKREVFEKENPGVTLPPLEEAASVDGLEHFETFNFRFNSEEDYMMVMDVIRQMVYNQGYTKYYIEYVSETSETVEFEFYVGK